MDFHYIFFLSSKGLNVSFQHFLSQTKSEWDPCDILCSWTLLQQVQLFSFQVSTL